ncbi:hypothetical protein [Mycoplana ramosa]|uniref:Uncharacterized protein n=1 Tax=Mycoplana ramosa TaxID=40837 RepID=A0ABW3Z295_MYCRA
MIIQFSPQRRSDSLSIQKIGDVLTINGEAFDFSALPDGATIPAGEIPCPFIEGAVDRVGGQLRIILVLPCAADAPQTRRFPAPIIDPADGPITLPGD